MPRNIQSNKFVHKHYHYHYYPQADENPFQNPQKSLVNTSVTPQKNQRYHPQASCSIYMEDDQPNSWKRHINPQITRMYQEISINSSINEQLSGQNSYALDRGNNENLKSQFYGKSRKDYKQNLKYEIEKYEQYLRQRSEVNLYVPGTKSMINLRNLPSYERLSHISNIQNESEVQKMYRKKKLSQKNGIQSQMANNIKRYKEEFSTFFTNQISAIKTLKQQKQQYEHQNMVGTVKNEKKRSKKQIQSNMKETKGTKAINSGEGLQSNAQKITKPSDFLFSSFNKKQFQQQMDQRVQYYDQLYRYKLLQEECNYLRDHFIQHIDQHHSNAPQR